MSGLRSQSNTQDTPIVLVSRPVSADRVFRAIATMAALFALVLVVAAVVSLSIKAAPAIRAAGFVKFFSGSVWNPSVKRFGVFGLLIGTVIIALIAMAVAFPLGIGMALFINEFAPRRLSRVLTGVVDLLAAMPSIIIGFWGRDALQGRLRPIATWLSNHLVALPFFQTSTVNRKPLVYSSFIAGVVVGLMVIPILTSVARDVMAQTPREQCEGALALGGTRWGMIRTVILPFGRSGIVGGFLLGFGRALGETVAVAMTIELVFNANFHVLEKGAGSIAAAIAVKFGEASQLELSGLAGAGLALLLLTIVVNMTARRVVSRTGI
jgi:phosphate transport system permease protein